MMILGHSTLEDKLMYLVQYSPDRGKTSYCRWENSADLLCMDKIRNYYAQAPAKRRPHNPQSSDPANGRRPCGLTIHGVVNDIGKPLFVIEYSDQPGAIHTAAPDDLQGEFMDELIDHCWQHVSE
jgi:hypothetical protein